nr:hypothetical protein [Kibdelosporangium sp. MJ126-NF4]CEL12672.1 hypothetical protein [Kibdelosporangium sp. MJ126-NF4]
MKPTSGTPGAFVDTRDIADAAVTVLTGNGHYGRSYTITGQDLVTFEEVATALAEASGRPVTHVDATLRQHREHFARSGRPDAWVDHMMHLFELVRAGAFTSVTDD